MVGGLSREDQSSAGIGRNPAPSLGTQLRYLTEHHLQPVVCLLMGLVGCRGKPVESADERGRDDQHHLGGSINWRTPNGSSPVSLAACPAAIRRCWPIYDISITASALREKQKRQLAFRLPWFRAQ
jgi:hypothetical protein